MHYFSLPWLTKAAQHLRTAAVYHIAHKQIPAKGGVKVPGLKLEMFIFDPFHTAETTTLYEVGWPGLLGLGCGCYCIPSFVAVEDHLTGLDAV